MAKPKTSKNVEPKFDLDKHVLRIYTDSEYAKTDLLNNLSNDGNSRVDQIVTHLEKGGYFNELDDNTNSSLELKPYNKEKISEELIKKGIKIGQYVPMKEYETPESKLIKPILINLDIKKHQHLTEENFIEEMTKLGLRKPKIEEFLQFILNNKEQLKNGLESVHMPDKRTNLEGHPYRIVGHSKAIAQDVSKYEGFLFDCTYLFVIKE